jgi:hypothetical protein
VGTLFGLLVIAGAVIHYFWWIVAGAAAIYGWYKWRVFKLACQMHETAEARWRDAVGARADQQQAWTLAGDLRGLYGRYPPTTT